MRPIWVSMPVAVTTARPRPETTAVPLKTMFRTSPGEETLPPRGAAVLATATDSPVRADSSAARACTARRRASALTRSPASSRRMSPGTTTSTVTVRAAPSRSIVARGAAIFFKASRERSARNSWTNPRRALASTITRMVRASAYSPRRAETKVAARRTSTMKSRNWFKKRAPRETRDPSARRFGPKRLRRRAASSSVRPLRGSTPKFRQTSAAGKRVSFKNTGTANTPLCTAKPVLDYLYARGPAFITG